MEDLNSNHINGSIKKMNFILLCSGLIVQGKKLTQIKKIKSRLIYIINFLWLNSDLLGAICWFIDGIKNGKTFVEVTYIAPCITFSFLANFKAIFIIYYEDNIRDLINDLLELEDRDKKIDVKRDGLRNDALNFLHLILKSSFVLNLVLIIAFTIGPFIVIATIYIKTKEVDLLLPFLIKYPFDSHDIRYWPFVYVHQFWSVAIVLVNICGADHLLYICCTHLRVQFSLLQYDLSNIVNKNSYLSNHDLGLVETELVELIKWHQALIKLSNKLEVIYSKSTLYNFISSSVLICLTGFNVVAIQNVAIAFMFLVFLSASLLQIYLLCFFGDLLMNSTMEVRDAVYNCKWYYLNAKIRKNLIIVHSRAQEPCKLTAFGFSDVNLRAFMSILSSSWSYFALLKTVYNPVKN
ncbi:putative odorant receptor 92a [Vanessa cardui]|uniref:putative odorant receptor 92a n=1 Tax=Vanessa cardui TaxID=171605 RepID=UPI001F1466A0|nr:putative odorant receptor 92a [Vanessa cardui]